MKKSSKRMLFRILFWGIALLLAGVVIWLYAIQVIGTLQTIVGLNFCFMLVWIAFKIFRYVIIFKNGVSGTGTLLSDGTERLLGIRTLYRPRIKFFISQERFKLHLYGTFFAPPASVGSMVDIKYWDVYPRKVILDGDRNLKQYVNATLCFDLLLLITSNVLCFVVIELMSGML